MNHLSLNPEYAKSSGKVASDADLRTASGQEALFHFEGLFDVGDSDLGYGNSSLFVEADKLSKKAQALYGDAYVKNRKGNKKRCKVLVVKKSGDK